MNKLQYLTYIFVLFWFISCNEALEIEDTIEQETANTALAFDKYGFQSVLLISTYEEVIYSLPLTYEESGDLTMALQIDSSALVNYNSLYGTDYSVLPSDYYSLDSPNTISEDTAITFTFYASKLVEAVGLTEASNFVLPLQITVENAEIILNTTMCSTIIHPEVQQPTLTLAYTEINTDIADTSQLSALPIMAMYNTNELDTNDVSIAVDENGVVAYNSAYGTEYSMLPEGSYSIKESSVDSESNSLTFTYQIDNSSLELTTYLLPVKLSSDTYAISPDTTIFNVITLYNTAPAFLKSYSLELTATVNDTYATTAVSFSLDSAAKVFETTVDDLTDNIKFYGINNDETTVSEYTANTGFWYTDEGNVVSYGADGCSLFVEYAGDGVFNVGQYPDATEEWDSYTVSIAMVFGGNMIRYNITLNIIPEFLATYDLTINEDVDATYASTALNFDFAEAAGIMGVSETTLSANQSFYALNSDGNLVTDYTANTGFWYSNDGDVTTWGTDGCALFVEYGGDGIFNVGQFPDATTSGDTYNITIILVYDGSSMIRYNITLKIN